MLRESITSFLDDLAQKENKSLHRELVKLHIGKKHPGKSIVFDDNHDLSIDDIVKCDNLTACLEYKTDYMAKKTGNMVLELVPWVDYACFPCISGTRFNPLDSDFPQIINVIEKVRRGDIVAAKLGRHFIKEPENYFFSYAILKERNYKAKTIDDVDEHLVFQNGVLKKYVEDNYMNGKLIITHTTNSENKTRWHTISLLTNVSVLRKLAL